MTGTCKQSKEMAITHCANQKLRRYAAARPSLASNPAVQYIREVMKVLADSTHMKNLCRRLGLYWPNS